MSKKKYQYTIAKMRQGFDQLEEAILAEEFDYIVALNRGGLVPATYMSNRWKIPMTVVSLTNRDKLGFSYNTLRDVRAIGSDIIPISSDTEPKKILLVEDIIDSGETVADFYAMLGQSVHPDKIKKHVKLFSLIYNKKNKHKVKSDFYHQEHDGSWVVFDWER